MNQENKGNKKKYQSYGMLLIAIGFVLQLLSHVIGGTNVKDFVAGLLMGMSIAVMVVGVYVLGRAIREK